ncbi:MAG: hypothetical protein CMC63_11230 [Flavobacteriaceae bacterium]|nr:hypothetical protein [Flavobacteriaceae bacterium]
MTIEKKNKHRPVYSIIMSVYNGELYLKETIQSVINQSYKKWELIIVDNCSTDRTIDILNDFQSGYDNIKIYATDINSGGPALPRNIGIKNSEGSYLAFIDSDDIWYEEKLETQLDYVNKFSLICSLANRVDENGKRLSSERVISDQIIDLSVLARKNKIIHSSVVVQKDLFLSIMFDEDKFLNGLEDINAYRRYLARNGDGILIGKPLVEHRIISQSLGSNIVGEQRFVKGIYGLTKSMIATERYDNILLCLFIKIRSYIKYLIVKKLNHIKNVWSSNKLKK